MLTDHFDRVVILNLRRRADRHRETAAAFEQIGETIDGKRIAFVESIDPAERGGFPSRGARGCFLSHLRELKRAQADGIERLLICEDDVQFAKGFQQRASAWLPRFRQEPWGLLYLGYETVGFGPAQEKPPAHFKLRTTSCYAVHGNYFAPLVQFIEELQSRPAGDPRGGVMEIDGAYNHFRRKYPECATYVAVPRLVTQRSSSSDIHPSLVDRWAVLRELADRFRIFLRSRR